MDAYEGLEPYYGDLHSHCGISYGHGSLDDAFKNAGEQLDFCSVTGHALWPDMPAPDATIQYIVDFHREGFARLRERWEEVQRTTAAYHQEGDFVTFLSFEMHSSADGDRTILYCEDHGELLSASGLDDLHRQLRMLRNRGVGVVAFPHHIAYKRGQRGINWRTFDPAFAPVVEIISMHGCSEADACPRPFLHSMGPADYESTWQHGLLGGHVAGVIGSTDHHSGHPGSYGHGRTAIWATAKTRDALWEGLLARRTYALTGDRIRLAFAVNGQPMGSVLGPIDCRKLCFNVVGGAPIDCVDVVKSGALLRRFSAPDVERDQGQFGRTKLLLEVGWGARGKRVDWDVRLGISAGRILSVEPRFRGPEVVAPQEATADAPAPGHSSHWERDGERAVWFRTITHGNPSNRTPATQAMCLEVELPAEAGIWAEINGRRVSFPLADLRQGARAGRLGKIDSPSYRFHRAPMWGELAWQGSLEETASIGQRDHEGTLGDVYYLRVRQSNDEWAWSSPVWVRRS